MIDLVKEFKEFQDAGPEREEIAKRCMHGVPMPRYWLDIGAFVRVAPRQSGKSVGLRKLADYLTNECQEQVVMVDHIKDKQGAYRNGFRQRDAYCLVDEFNLLKPETIDQILKESWKGLVLVGTLEPGMFFIEEQDTWRSKQIRQIMQSETFPKVVHKPWGKEEILSYNEHYCFKRITIFEGCATSLQYHRFKHETSYIDSGEAEYTYQNDVTSLLESKRIGAGFNVVLKPFEVHRFKALTEIVLYEASTPETWDVVRLEDSYGREGTSNP